MDKKKLSKGQKQILIVVAAGAALYLLYRWYANRNAANATTTMVPGSATDPQYAALAGQQQSDMASLQRQILGLTQYERLLEKQIKNIQSGHQGVDRTKTVKVKKGSKLWDYYKKVTGKDPPAQLQVTNLIYELWQAGVSATKARQLFGKPEHPGSHPGATVPPWHGFHEPGSWKGATVPPWRGFREPKSWEPDPRHHRDVDHPNRGHHQRDHEHHRHPHSGGASPTPNGHHHGDHHHNKGTSPSGVRR
jgi:hypothetical protein